MKDLKRERIMDVAFSLFREHGFQGATTAKIAKEAKVATGTLFYHFPTKDDLINELFQHVSKQMLDHVMSQISINEEPKMLIKKVWLSIIKWNVAHPNQFKFSEQYYASPYIRLCKIESDNINPVSFNGIIKAYMDQGIVKKQELRLFLLHFDYSVKAVSNYFILENKEYDESIVQEQFNLLWSGIQP